MERPANYIEPSVVSYLVATPSRDLIVAAHQQLRSDWWARESQKYNLFVSRVVLDEARAGNKDFAAKRVAALEGLPLLEVNNQDRTRWQPHHLQRCP
jgi:hypothetical protein